MADFESVGQSFYPYVPVGQYVELLLDILSDSLSKKTSQVSSNFSASDHFFANSTEGLRWPFSTFSIVDGQTANILAKRFLDIFTFFRASIAFFLIKYLTSITTYCPICIFRLTDNMSVVNVFRTYCCNYYYSIDKMSEKDENITEVYCE